MKKVIIKIITIGVLLITFATALLSCSIQKTATTTETSTEAEVKTTEEKRILFHLNLQLKKKESSVFLTTKNI